MGLGWGVWAEGEVCRLEVRGMGGAGGSPRRPPVDVGVLGVPPPPLCGCGGVLGFPPPSPCGCGGGFGGPPAPPVDVGAFWDSPPRLPKIVPNQ